MFQLWDLFRHPAQTLILPAILHKVNGLGGGRLGDTGGADAVNGI